MKLIDIKDTLPVGFIPIQETIDTRKLVSVLQSRAWGGPPPVPVWLGGGGLRPRQGHALSAATLWGYACMFGGSSALQGNRLWFSGALQAF